MLTTCTNENLRLKDVPHSEAIAYSSAIEKFSDLFSYRKLRVDVNVVIWQLCLQTISATCTFPDVQSAVDTTVQILQCGIPMARIGQSMCFVLPIIRTFILLVFLIHVSLSNIFKSNIALLSVYRKQHFNISYVQLLTDVQHINDIQ